VVSQGLRSLPEHPGEPDEGEGRDDEDQERGHVQELDDDNAHGKRDRCPVGYISHLLLGR